MGLGTAPADRTAVEETLGKWSGDARAASGEFVGHPGPVPPGTPPARVVRLIYDAPPFFRSKAQTKVPITIASLAQALLSHVFRQLSGEYASGPVVPEVYILFDTQELMPRQRDAVALKRSPPATDEQLKKAAADPLDRRVVVNGRLFDPEQVPLSADELAALDQHTEVLFPRLMNSRAGKERLYALLETEIVAGFVERPSEFQLRAVVDGPGVGDNAVTTVVRSAGAGADTVVTVTTGPRQVHHGEADQKCADVAVFSPSPDPAAATLIITVDTDQLAQQLILAEQRLPENRNTFIAFLPHARAATRQLRYIDTYGFPTDGSGSGIAVLLAIAGTDYTVSLNGCALSLNKALEHGLEGVPAVFTGTGAAVFDSANFVETLRLAFDTGKPIRNVYSFGSSPAYISKPAAAAAAAMEGFGGQIRKRPRTLEDLHIQLAPLAWVVAYWGLAGRTNRPAGPPTHTEWTRVGSTGSGTLFDMMSAPVKRFLQPGPVRGAGKFRV